MIRILLMNSLVSQTILCFAGQTVMLCDDYKIKIKLTSDLRIMLMQESGFNDIYMKLVPSEGEVKVITEDITPYQIKPLSFVEIYDLANDRLAYTYKINNVEHNHKRKREEESFVSNKKKKLNNELDENNNSDEDSIEIESSSVDIKYPITWEKQENECDIFELEMGSHEYGEIRSNFLKYLPNLHAEIIKISRIQNKRLYSWYYLKKNEITNKPMNKRKDIEKLLYHGTVNQYFDQIVKEGLDPRLAKLSGAIGVGVYFAESPKTSLPYVSTTDEIKKKNVPL